MTDQPGNEVEQGAPGVAAISTDALQEITDEVLFVVEQVGTFTAKRLSGKRSMELLKRRRAIMREVFGTVDCLPDELLSAHTLATLQVIEVAPATLDTPCKWFGLDDDRTQDDVLVAVYDAYVDQCKLVVKLEVRAQKDLKN